MTTETETAEITSMLKYCDICGRSEIDAMIDDRGELLNIEWSHEHGCMVCDTCYNESPDHPDEMFIDTVERQQRGISEF